MRRLVVWLLIGLCVPWTADARLMVVVDKNRGTTAAIQARQDRQDARTLAMAGEILDRTVGRANYKIVPPELAKTEFCGSGRMVWNYGSAGAYVETFDAVLHVTFNGKMASLANGGYRPDSLTVGGTTYSHSVPQLFWWIQSGNVGYNIAADSLSDSTGTSTTAPGSMKFLGSSLITFPLEIPSSDPTRPYWTTSVHGFVAANATPPAGGLRILNSLNKKDGVSSEGNALELAGFQMSNNGDNSLPFSGPWLDSTKFVANSDNMTMWLRPMSHISGAKPLIFSVIHGTSDCTDSLGASFRIPCEGDAQAMLMSLAVLDSAAGGNVFSKDLLPLKLGVVVRGGFNRGGLRNPGGIVATDSAAFKVSMDSLATLSPAIPITVQADVDSIESYASEKGWWLRLPKVKFSPYTRAGVDTARNLGATSAVRPVDVFGLYRTRIALGDGSYLGADTASVYSGVRRLFYKADSTFGRDYVSRFLTAPLDDFSAENMAISIDSTLYAATLAGARGFLIDAQEQQASRTNPRSWNFGGQRMYRAFGKDIPLLGHTGYRINGSDLIYDVRAESTTVLNADYPMQTQGTASLEQFVFPHLISYECARAINGLLFSKYRDTDMMPHQYPDNWDGVNTSVNDRIYGIKHASVFVCSANDFVSGRSTGSASRPAYWTLKSLNNYMRAVNALAYVDAFGNQRRIITFDWPENIAP